jgi:hypothetical protein
MKLEKQRKKVRKYKIVLQCSLRNFVYSAKLVKNYCRFCGGSAKADPTRKSKDPEACKNKCLLPWIWLRWGTFIVIYLCKPPIILRTESCDCTVAPQRNRFQGIRIFQTGIKKRGNLEVIQVDEVFFAPFAGLQSCVGNLQNEAI